MSEEVKQPLPEEPVPEEAPVAPIVKTVPPAILNAKPAAPTVAVPKEKIIRIPFPERLLASDKDLLNNYNELKSEALSYGLKSRVSNTGDTFRLHTKTYLKITVAGKSLKIYYALKPSDYATSPIPVQDASGKNIYKEIPVCFKVKSPLSLRRAKQLIADVCEHDNLEQGKIVPHNWAADLKDYKPTGASDGDDSGDADEAE